MVAHSPALNPGWLSVQDPLCTNHPGPKDRRNGLVPQADAEDRQETSEAKDSGFGFRAITLPPKDVEAVGSSPHGLERMDTKKPWGLWEGRPRFDQSVCFEIPRPVRPPPLWRWATTSCSACSRFQWDF